MNLESETQARAYPRSDALNFPLRSAENGQRVPQNPRLRLKKLVDKSWKKEGKLRLGSWNVGSMTGKGREIVDVMQRRKIDILCVQETKWKGQSARNLGEGYKLYYNGQNNRRSGVGIILKKEIQDTVIGVIRVNERLMAIRLFLNGTTLHVISVYAPQVGCPEIEKEHFREALEDYLINIEESEVVVLAGDMNCHVGQQNIAYEYIHGGKGYGTRNEDGERVLEMAEAFNLVILNTCFQKRQEHLITYKSGRNKTQIDYILMKARDRKLAIDCKVLPGEPVVTQHRLLLCDLRLRKQIKPKVKYRKRKVKTWKLKGETKEEYKRKVTEQLENMPGNLDTVEQKWTVMKNTLTGIAKDVCGITKSQQRSDKETWWWKPEIQNILKQKKQAFKDMKDGNDANAINRYKECKKAAKRAVAMAKNEAYKEWYDKLDTLEGEQLIYRIAKARDNAKKDMGEVKIVKDKEGKVLTQDCDIKVRWKEYYNELLNNENERGELEEIHRIEGPITNVTREEVKEAVKKSKNNKAVGSSDVSIEMIKALDDVGIDYLHDLIEGMWKEEIMPKDFTKSEIIKLFKNKGDILSCQNYRGIKILEHVFKVFERIVEGRLRDFIEINELQFGFMPGKSTIDAIFIARQMQEKLLEGNKKSYWCFVDLEKAFDRVPREVVHWCLRKRGVPEKLVRLVQMMYTNAVTCVRTAYGNTDAFPVNVGLHQGSALSPFLFAVVLDTLVENAGENEGLQELLFADDLVLVAESLHELQNRYLEWKARLERGGLRINTEKTEVMLSSRGGEEEINVDSGDGTCLQQVSEFKYLGSMLCKEGGSELAVRERVKVGWKKWKEVAGVVLDKKIKLKLRIKIYKTIIRPVILYGAETWALRKKEESLLERTEMRMIRWMSGISLMERRRSEDIRKMVGICNIKEKAREARLRYYGHVKRREEGNIIKRVLDMPVTGRRSVGRQRIRWKDVIEKDMGMKSVRNEDIQNRNAWRRMTRAADPTTVWD